MNTRFNILLLAVLVVATLSFAAPAPFTDTPLIGDAPVPQDAKFSFVVLGDKTSGGEGKWPIYDRAVDSINLLDPDFVITVGDQIPGHMQEHAQWDAEWAEYLAHARRLEMPLLLTVGNHDIANIECYEFWKQDFGRTYYSFNYNDAHFLVLNTEEERFDGRGPVWQKMLTFMEADLDANKAAAHTFVFFHKPMWDDPRYDVTWARLVAALEDRHCTVFAGHEHYMMTEQRGNMLLMLQSATGGGMRPSEVPEFGSFHSFTHVVVDGSEVTYAVMEPEGHIWPVDIAPASFRKAIGNEILTIDAAPGLDCSQDDITVRTTARFQNVFAHDIAVLATIQGLETVGWKPQHKEGGAWSYEEGSLTTLVLLQPGQIQDQTLAFSVPQDRLDTPPKVSWRVQYEGGWLDNENMPMVAEDVLPIHPVDSLKTVPEWAVIGPFPLGDIDTAPLPENPEKANPNFFKAFGPEDGYDANRTYEGGVTWKIVPNQGRGLINFNAILGTLDHVLGYAVCEVYSPVEQLTHATVYSDNYHQVVLNGGLVEEGQDFGAPSGFTYVPLALKAGWNTVAVKLINNHGDWFLRVLMADPNANLKFRAKPE